MRPRDLLKRARLVREARQHKAARPDMAAVRARLLEGLDLEALGAARREDEAAAREEVRLRIVSR